MNGMKKDSIVKHSMSRRRKLKILHATWNIFQQNENKICISPNGGSIMIFNICNWIGKKVESYAFCGNIKMQEAIYENVIILANDKFLSDMDNRGEDIDKWLCNINKAFEDILDEIKFDFIFVHGGLDFSINCINSCIKKNIPYAYVSHAYQGQKDLNYFDKSLSLFEDKLFRIPDINIITVGNGMRKRLLKEKPYIMPERVTTIRNAVEDIKTKDLIIRNEKRNLLCIGTISPNKNQLQLLRAYSLLDKDIKEKINIIICGKDSKKTPTLENINKTIDDLSLTETVKYLGSISRDEMENMYEKADGLITTSLCEGLSLVVLEMLKYGKPVIMFSDNETAEDVNDELAVILIKDHSDESVARAIEQWYREEWDYNHIFEYSKEFNMEQVAEEYIMYVKKLGVKSRKTVIH